MNGWHLFIPITLFVLAVTEPPVHIVHHELEVDYATPNCKDNRSIMAEGYDWKAAFDAIDPRELEECYNER